jgi:PAS domain S-box-containing protein
LKPGEYYINNSNFNPATNGINKPIEDIMTEENLLSSSIKILLIEDNPGDARLIHEYLKSDKNFHHEIQWVTSLNEINSYKDQKPDIILLDLNLPESIGIETFDIVQSRFPDLPIIVQTGLNDELTGYSAVSKGAQDYLIKGNFSGPLLIKSLQYGIERNNLVNKIQLEKLKHEREEIISEIFENASVAIYRTTSKGEFLVVNAAMIKMFGYDSVQEFKLVNANDLYGNLEARKKFKSLLEEKKVITDYEEILIKKDKSLITTLESCKIVDDGKGNIYYEGFIEDISKRKEAEAALSDSLKEKEVLLRELYHRTKNNMQVISSLLGIKADLINDESVKSILNDMGGRIRTIALVHQKLYQSKNLSRIDLGDYIKDLSNLLMDSYSSLSGRVSLNLNLENVNVLIDTAIPCGLIINELITNAMKYAFPGNIGGEINISLFKANDDLITLIISDNGIGIPSSKDIFSGETLGIQLLTSIVEHQLLGKIEFELSKGVSCTISFKDSQYIERV